MAQEFPFAGATAVVTGAAGGIGAALAAGLAARGAHLALADRDEEGLERVAARLRSNRLRVSVHPLDVTERDATAALPDAVRRAHGGAAILVNNAGIAAGGTFEQVAEAVFDRVMEVNFHAPVRLTRAFLPLLREAPAGRIVNVSSLFGLLAPAGSAPYSASKFALRGFSEALRHELEGSPVGVTVVHPGGVRTSIARSSLIPEGGDAAEIARRRDAFEKKLRLPPEKAAEIILRAVERRRGRVLVGGDAKLLAGIARLFPETYWRRMAPLLGRD